MKEKESEQTNFAGDLENNNSKKKKIISIVSILLLIVIIALILFNRQVPQYTITFDSNGGSLVESVIVSENDTVPEPEDPTREGYEFAGWYYNDELYDFSKPVTSDMILEARWGVVQNVSGNLINQKELTLMVGDTANILDLLGIINGEDVTWKSNKPDIVSIDANGNIIALKEGVATITVITKDGTYTITIIVKGPTSNEIPSDETSVKVTGVSLNKTALSLTEGESSKLIATIRPSNATNKNVIWRSSNSNIVSVDENGNIKALKEGTAIITVTTRDGGYTARATITVIKATTPTIPTTPPTPTTPTIPTTPTTPTVVNVTGVSLNKTALSLTEGESSKLTATVNPSNATNKDVTWESSNPDIVSVDSNGNIKALQPGSATITVITKDGNYKASCQVTVKAKVASYNVIFTPIVQEGTGAIVQYSVAVTKDNSSFDGFKFISYNGTIVGKTTLAKVDYNTNITSATIRLNDGTDVTATVLYK